MRECEDLIDEMKHPLEVSVVAPHATFNTFVSYYIPSQFEVNMRVLRKIYIAYNVFRSSYGAWWYLSTAYMKKTANISKIYLPFLAYWKTHIDENSLINIKTSLNNYKNNNFQLYME